jgi:hypothetical protein
MSLKQFPNSSLNKISKTLRKYLDDRKLLTNQLAKYRVICGTRNLDRDKADGEILYPSCVTIPLFGKVIDPGDKGEDNKITNNGLVEIGVVKFFDEKTGDARYRKFPVYPKKNDPFFLVRGNIGSEVEAYEALELSNYNASNPYRDQGVQPLFERVDDVAEARAVSKKRNKLRECWNMIASWDNSQLKVIASSYNLSATLDAEIIKEQLEKIAEADPEKFYAAVDSPETRAKAIVKMAKDANLITHNVMENKWTLTGSDSILASFDRNENVTSEEQLAEWLLSSNNGPAVSEQLVKLIKKQNSNTGNS